jgi:hypothetical protein
MGIIEGTNKVGVGNLGSGEAGYLTVEYDSAVDSKETGSHNLRGGTLPSGAVIVDTLVRVQTKLESGGEATVLLTAESEGDIQASKKVSEAPWKETKAARGAVTATGTPVTTTASRHIVAKIGTAALTAGKFQVVVKYLVFS